MYAKSAYAKFSIDDANLCTLKGSRRKIIYGYAENLIKKLEYKVDNGYTLFFTQAKNERIEGSRQK